MPEMKPLHPLCAMFPPLSEHDLKSLAIDISVNGQEDPISVLNGMVIDGQNRQLACAMAGVKPDYRDVLMTDLEALSYVMSKNDLRRHMTPGQRAVIASMAMDWAKAHQPAPVETTPRPVGAEPVEPEPEPETEPRAQWAPGSEERAEAAGVSRRTQQRADRIVKEAPDLAQQVAVGKVTLRAAERTVAAAAAPDDVEDEGEVVSQGEEEFDPEPVEGPKPQVVSELDKANSLVAELRERVKELGLSLEETVADNASMAKVFDSNDQLAAAVKEIKQLNAEIRVLRDTSNGHLNGKNELIRQVSTWKRRALKAEEELAKRQTAA